MTTNDEIAERVILYLADAGLYPAPSLIRSAIDHAIPPVDIPDDPYRAARQVADNMTATTAEWIEAVAAQTKEPPAGFQHVVDCITGKVA